jgi:NitT/TauT family transport system permease protein
VSRSNPSRALRLTRRVRSIWPAALAVVAVLGLWQLAASQGWVDALILPAPTAIVAAFPKLVSSGAIWSNAKATLASALYGFAVGSGVAWAAATACATFPLLRRAVYPLAVALQVTPRIAVTPILIAWLGFGSEPRILLGATVCFFPVFLNTLTAFESADAETKEMFRSLRASRRQTLSKLLLPETLPIVVAGLKTALTLGVLSAVVFEFVSAKNGLGVLMQRFAYQLQMEAAWAVLVTLTLLGLVLYGLMEILDRWLIYWMHEERLVSKAEKRARKSGARDEGLRAAAFASGSVAGLRVPVGAGSAATGWMAEPSDPELA